MRFNLRSGSNQLNHTDSGAGIVRPPRRGLVAYFSAAFAGVTPQSLSPILALVIAYAFSHHLNRLVYAVVHGHFLKWSWAFAGDAVSFLPVAAIVYLPVVAVGTLGPQSGWRRGVALATTILLAVPAAVLARFVWGRLIWVWSPGIFDVDFDYLLFLRTDGVTCALFAGFMTLVSELLRRERRSLTAIHATELDRVNLARQMAQARIQVLQAQIEPHFLFNTLANVRRLYQTDDEAGRRMLENLMRYLEVALPRMRDAASTLAAEATLVESFLVIHRIRMGRRLAFSIDIADGLKQLNVPPMMLLTLVENAIKHGLNPLPEGGTVSIAAQADEDHLTITVADTGRGLTGSGGSGTGLANIRARLQASFGESAKLSLSGNAPRGIVATLSLPRAGLNLTLAETEAK